jgi:hypothetical protein
MRDRFFIAMRVILVSCRLKPANPAERLFANGRSQAIAASSALRMHRHAVASKHFYSSNPLPFRQRRFRRQIAMNRETLGNGNGKFSMTLAL